MTHAMLAFEFAGGWNDMKGSVAVTVLQFLLGGGGSFSAGGPGADGLQCAAFEILWNFTRLEQARQNTLQYTCHQESAQITDAVTFGVVESCLDDLFLGTCASDGCSCSFGTGKGMHSRLYRRVLNANEWVHNCTAFNSLYNDTGLVGIFISGDCQGSAQRSGKLIDILTQELQVSAQRLQNFVDHADSATLAAAVTVWQLMLEVTAVCQAPSAQ